MVIHSLAKFAKGNSICTIGLFCVLGCSLAIAQERPEPSPAANYDSHPAGNLAAASSNSVGMNDVVLTIKGFCLQAEKSADACQTQITRAQFEKLAAAIRPNMSASVKQQIANLYPRLLVMSHKAEELGLDKQAPYEEMIDFSRMQILAQALSRKLQQDSSNISDEEIADYYKHNASDFDEYTLQRMVVPLRKQVNGSTIEKSKDDESRSRSTPQPEPNLNASPDGQLEELAKTLQARAAAGENFVKLQQSAFEAAGVKVASVNTSMGSVRRSALPAAHAVIIAKLKPGEVSPVITDSGGHYIYKLQAEARLTLEEAKPEVRRILEAQRSAEALDRVQNSYKVETNKSYFAVPQPAKPEP